MSEAEEEPVMHFAAEQSSTWRICWEERHTLMNTAGTPASTAHALVIQADGKNKSRSGSVGDDLLTRDTWEVAAPWNSIKIGSNREERPSCVANLSARTWVTPIFHVGPGGLEIMTSHYLMML